MRGLFTLCSILSLLALAPIEARACSLAPNGWNAYNPVTEFGDIPVEGVVLIQAALYNNGIEGLTEERGLEAITVTVTDADGAGVPGSLALGPRGFFGVLVWRADAPLETSSTYTLEAVFDNDALAAEFGEGASFFEETLTVEMVLRTPSYETPAPTPPTLIEARLTEWSESTSQVCCPVDPQQCIGTCGDYDACSRCFAEGYAYHPMLEVDFDADTLAGLEAYTYYEVLSGTGGTADTLDTTYSAGSWSPLSTSIHFDAQAEDYCLQVIKRTLLDGRSAESEVVCVPDAARVEAERLSPDYSVLAQCTELPEGYDRSGPIDESVDEGCGCQLRRGDGGGPALPLALMAAAGLFVGWRRRRIAGDGGSR